MPFGCSIACSTFEKFSSFLHWALAKNSNNPNIIHYLDDFLFAGSSNTSHCAQLAVSFQTLCNQFGIPINADKTQGPTINLTFLGLSIDTISQTIFIPEDKRQELKSCLTLLLESKKVSLKQMQSLCVSLNFVAKALPGGRTFCRRFYNATIGIRKSHFMIKVTNSIRADAKIWIQFLENYNNKKTHSLIWSGPVMMLLTFTPTVVVPVVEVHFITTTGQ